MEGFWEPVFWSSMPLHDIVSMKIVCDMVGVLSACLAKPLMKREALAVLVIYLMATVA